MTRLADTVDGVIGVDTHRDTLAAAATDRVGGVLAQTETAADLAGYQRLLEFGRAQVPGRRCWAVEGAGSYGAGLTSFLQARGEWVVEIGRPKRPARRTGAKSDALDALRAAGEALACDHLVTPRRRGDREALRVLLATRHSACRAKVSAINQLKALIVGAPEELRAELRGLGTKRQIARCAVLRERPTRSLEHRMTVRALHSTAQRIRLLSAEAAGLRAELERLVTAVAPWLLELSGVGADQRRPGAGELVARRPAALRGRLCRSGRRQPDPGVVRAGDQASAEPWRGSAAQPGATYDRAGAAAR
jgi:transposase